MDADSIQDQERTVWQKLFVVSHRITEFGAILGTVAILWKGREFTAGELGWLAWPLSIVYLIAFAYVFMYLVHTRTSKKLRYLFIYPALVFVALFLTLAVTLIVMGY